MKQLTRKQLQNDLNAARKHAEMLRNSIDNVHRELALERSHRKTIGAAIEQANAERDDWRAAFKTISKLVK